MVKNRFTAYLCQYTYLFESTTLLVSTKIDEVLILNFVVGVGNYCEVS